MCGFKKENTLLDNKICLAVCKAEDIYPFSFIKPIFVILFNLSIG
jgi:hypothetical protein